MSFRRVQRACRARGRRLRETNARAPSLVREPARLRTAARRRWPAGRRRWRGSRVGGGRCRSCEGSICRPGAITRTTGIAKAGRVRSTTNVSISWAASRVASQRICSTGSSLGQASCRPGTPRGCSSEHVPASICVARARWSRSRALSLRLAPFRALGGHHGVGELALTQLHDRAAGGAGQRRARTEAAGEALAVRVARDGCDRRDAQVRRDVEKPGAAALAALPERGQQLRRPRPGPGPRAPAAGRASRPATTGRPRRARPARTGHAARRRPWCGRRRIRC